MEQKHTIEENGYYSQVTDQLIENIGYQMIRPELVDEDTGG